MLNQEGKWSNKKETDSNVVQGLHDVINIYKSRVFQNIGING